MDPQFVFTRIVFFLDELAVNNFSHASLCFLRNSLIVRGDKKTRRTKCLGASADFLHSSDTTLHVEITSVQLITQLILVSIKMSVKRMTLTGGLSHLETCKAGWTVR